jgi:hypothetical protein
MQRDVMVDTCQLQPHLEMKHVRKKRLSRERKCCSVLFSAVPGNDACQAQSASACHLR